MALVHLLFRCPRCGHDPMAGTKDKAECGSCGTAFSRGGEGALIRVVHSDGESWEVPSRALTLALERWLAEEVLPEDPQVTVHSAQAWVRRSGPESPVRWGGQLIGFAEAMGERVAGRLRLTGDRLVFTPDSVEPEPAGAVPGEATWLLMDIRAVQTSSSSLQFSPALGGLVEFKFPSDSPFRWEHLLHRGLRNAYQKAGLGTIVEFQPRIVAE
jgi:hypothetical protein